LKRVIKRTAAEPEPEPAPPPKKRGPAIVRDMSGHCRFAAGYGSAEQQAHRSCHGEWDTPSAHVVCTCPCHDAPAPKRVRRVVRRKQ
jgi:hypothetical protein